MFKDFEDYFDCVLSHYANPSSKIDLICKDAGLKKEVVIEALRKRSLL